MKKYVLLLFLGMINLSLIGQDAEVIVAKMLKSIDNCRSMEFDLETRERFGTAYSEGSGHLKLQVEPFKLYMKQQSPNAGIEILYNEGENNNKAIVNPPGPIKAINLSTNSGKMRKHNHYSILDIGFKNVANLIRKTKAEVGENFNNHFKLSETLDVEGNSCYLLVITFDELDYIEYTVPTDILLRDLADKKLLSEFKIMELNGITSYGKIKEGTQLQLPTRFTNRIELYINKSSYLPISQALFDDQGLFERYEYKNLIVNPAFKPDEFTPSFKEYSF